MKKTRLDRQQDFLMGLLRPLVYLWMRKDAKRRVILKEGVSFRRKEPYVMLANHTFMFDVIHVPLRFKKVPFIVANQSLFKKKATKFLVTQVAHVISKNKGQSDTQTVRDLITAVKKGYPILIFPEGDTTFFGETNYIEPSTMKLIKKLGIDVITCKVKEGYLSKPRWATSKRKHRTAELEYELTIPKEKLKDMTVEEIDQIIKKRLYYNAYEDQKTKMVYHPGRKLAEGLEDILYICPNCEHAFSMKTDGNTLFCDSCKTKGFYNPFGFIEGFKYDNLVDWNKFQLKFKDKLLEAHIATEARLFIMHHDTQTLEPKGDIHLSYEKGVLTIMGGYDKVIPIEHVVNPVVTMRRDLSFDFEDTSYLITCEHYALIFLRFLQQKY
jgi:1-acyl-sn-glycerol-3-phosphate acyltransferase